MMKREPHQGDHVWYSVFDKDFVGEIKQVLVTPHGAREVRIEAYEGGSKPFTRVRMLRDVVLIPSTSDQVGAIEAVPA